MNILLFPMHDTSICRFASGGCSFEMWSFPRGGNNIFSSRIDPWNLWWAISYLHLYNILLGSSGHVKAISKKRLLVTRLRSELCPTFANELCHGCVLCNTWRVDVAILIWKPHGMPSPSSWLFSQEWQPESCLTFSFHGEIPCSNSLQEYQISWGYI